MARRPCLECKRLTQNPSRCNACQAAYSARVNMRRGGATARGYTYQWEKVRALVIQEHTAAFGWHCPGYNTTPHPADRLTVDHVVPKSAGGTDDRSNLQVLCRACNSRKHDRR